MTKYLLPLERKLILSASCGHSNNVHIYGTLLVQLRLQLGNGRLLSQRPWGMLKVYRVTSYSITTYCLRIGFQFRLLQGHAVFPRNFLSASAIPFHFYTSHLPSSLPNRLVIFAWTDFLQESMCGDKNGHTDG